ncbi:MAG: SurA N-terminal domain-containing protein [Paludibacteraceae bacterium]|nr:SurA N-terminal domain-containing protein [Paludibacteraceae bacterium]
MAVLEKIRSKGVLLLIVIGAAMLIFIISDFINSGSSFFQESNANVAIINGDKVKALNYQNKIEQFNDVVRIEYGNNVTDEMAEQIRNMVWESTLTEKLIADECELLGMMVTKDELSDMLFGQHISPMIRSSKLFVDQNGAFNPMMVKQLISTLDNEDAAQQYSPDDLRKLKNVWAYWEHATKAGRLQDKYAGLLSKSMVVNPLEAEYSYNNAKTTSDVLCTYKSYSTVSDSAVKVTDAEVKAKYDLKREQFKRERRAADIKYISFEIAPSQEDFQEAAGFLDEVRKELLNSDDIASVVNANSDRPFVEGAMFESQIPEEYRGFAFSGSDSIYGPVLFGKTFKMCKVLGRVTAIDSVKLSVIALKEATEDATKVKADSIEAALAGGADFAQLAVENSLAANAKTGGEIGWVTDMDLDKKLSEKVFSTSLHQTFRIEENGACMLYYVSEIGKPVSKVKLAMIEHEVIASTKTHTNIYNRLKQYVVKANTIEKFENEAAKASMPLMEAKNIDINASQINSLPKMREAVRWIFESKEGAVSDVIESDNQIIAVAVEKLYEEGYRSMKEVYDVLAAEVRREKKGEMLAEQMKGKNAMQLEAQGWRTDTLRGMSFASNFAGSMGMEPMMAAHVNFVEVGKTSAPVKGSNNAFVFTVLDRSESDRPYDEKEEMVMLGTREAYSINYFVVDALKRVAKIEDFRYKYY